MKTDDFSPLREVTGDVTEANVNISAVKRFIGFTIGFHNHREGPSRGLSVIVQLHRLIVYSTNYEAVSSRYSPARTRTWCAR